MADTLAATDLDFGGRSLGSWPAAVRGRVDRWVTAAIVLVTLAVYWRSLMPGIGYSGDAAKWQLLSEVGGITHATGYPLYVALIQAFGVVEPFGSAAWRTNLLSALFAVAAVAVLYRLLRMLDVRWPVAAAAALTFAFTKVFWSQAVIAEVYTLHLLFMVSILACLTRWRLGGSNRWLLGGIALLALSFGNHMSTVLIVPAVLWLVWSDRRRAITLRNALWAGLFALLGASQYLYLLYMYDVGGYLESPVEDLGDIWGMVTGGPFKDSMFGFTPREVIVERIPMLWRFMREEYLVLLAPMAYGLWCELRASRPRRDVAIAITLLGLGSAFYGLNFDVLDVIVFFLPLFLVLAVFLGLGLDRVVSLVEAHWPGRRVVALGVGAALLAIPAVTGLADYRKASQRGTIAASERIEAAIERMGGHAVILTDNYDDSQFFWYYLIGEGEGAKRNITWVHGATPRQVKEYFAGRPSPVADAAAGIQGTDRPPLYTASPFQPAEMRKAGLEVIKVGPELWRIDER